MPKHKKSKTTTAAPGAANVRRPHKDKNRENEYEYTEDMWIDSLFPEDDENPGKEYKEDMWSEKLFDDNLSHEDKKAIGIYAFRDFRRQLENIYKDNPPSTPEQKENAKLIAKAVAVISKIYENNALKDIPENVKSIYDCLRKYYVDKEPNIETIKKDIPGIWNQILNLAGKAPTAEKFSATSFFAHKKSDKNPIKSEEAATLIMENPDHLRSILESVKVRKRHPHFHTDKEFKR